MTSLNNVQILGNLGQDPELRKTNDGTSVTNLSVATNEVFSDKNGERQQRTEWHRIVVFGLCRDLHSPKYAHAENMLSPFGDNRFLPCPSSRKPDRAAHIQS